MFIFFSTRINVSRSGTRLNEIIAVLIFVIWLHLKFHVLMLQIAFFDNFRHSETKQV